MTALIQRASAKNSTIILLLLDIVAWGGLSLMGYYGLQSVAQQHAHGYPNAGQIHYYLYVPLTVLLVSVLWAVGLWRFSPWLRNSAPVIALILLPFYLLFYTGGV